MPFIRVSKRYAVNTDQISHVGYLGGGRLGVFVCGQDRSIDVDKENVPAVCKALSIDTPDKGEPSNKARGGSGVVG